MSKQGNTFDVDAFSAEEDGEIKDYVEETEREVLSLIRERFGEVACAEAKLALRNPLRELCRSAGDLVCTKDGIQCFQAAILRRGYIRESPFLGVCGGLLVAKNDASPVLLAMLIQKAITPRAGSELFFGNTAIPVSVKLNRMMGVRGKGIPSCEFIRCAVFRWGGFANFALHGRIPLIVVRIVDFVGRFLSIFNLRHVRSDTVCIRLDSFETLPFNNFWDRYLEGNDGVVLSRTAQELEWVFGDGLRSGRNILLARKRQDGLLAGYIVLRTASDDGLRWMVADWIALEDDRDVLSDLMNDAVRELRRMRSPVFLECIGFRMDVQDIIGRHLPFKRKAKNNSMAFKAFSSRLTDALKDGATKGWFFGPYDGDRCMS